MIFNVEKSIEILERTPRTLRTLLENLSPGWTQNNEGGESWSPYDVVGHLIHGEKTDWIPRAQIILSDRTDKAFEPFDRFAQFAEGEPKTLAELLDEFQFLRAENLDALRAMHISEADLKKTGIHPAFGEVNLSQLLATWVAHDLGHIAQVARVMAKQYREAVGPWFEYLRVLQV